MGKCRQAALNLYAKLQTSPDFITPFAPELDIVIFAPSGSSASEISQRSRDLFDAAADANLHLALVNFPQSLLGATWSQLEWDQPTITCLRSCLMKPDHLDWIERIWSTLEQTITKSKS